MTQTVQGSFDRPIRIALVVAVCLGLYLTTYSSYLLFHALVELFSIVVAGSIFMIGWNSRRYIKNNYLLFVSVAYLFIGGLDLLHTLSYKGMPIFTDYDYYANQLWIATRYLEALTLLAAFLFLRWDRDVNPHLIFLLYLAAFSLIVLSVFVWKVFPVCFVEGQGLTPFKKNSEYVISSLLVASFFLLRRFRSHFDADVYRKLALAIFCTVVSELAFTFYISNYGFSNLVGHYFKLFSFMLIYQAIIQTGITRPYDLIFRELKEKEDSLREARDAADKANKAKSEFLAAMSHEIRTPMNAVVGMAELTLQSRLDEEQRDNLKTIRDSGAHLMTIINDILDFSKIEAGRVELESIHFDVVHALKSVRRIFARLAEERGLSLDIEAAKDAPRFVQGDPLRLKQILVNLISNGLKFTDNGGVSVLLERDPEFPAGEGGKVGLLFVVSDTGIGIPEASRERIFEHFTQADSTTTRRYGGTGLGLAISRRLARLMGGELELADRKGPGSSFLLRVPFLEGDRDKALGGRHEAEIDPPDNETHPLRVLIVEDNPINRKVAERFLRRMGHASLVAGNGREALEMLSRETVDVVLMDVEMPEMDGVETTRRIRKGEAGQEAVTLPIIGMTAHVLEDMENTCRDAGMDDYVSKPVDFFLLKAMLRRTQESKAGSANTPGALGALVLDDKALRSRLGDDEETVELVFRAFVEDMPRRRKRMEEQFASGDLDQLGREAHSLKGSLGLIGAGQALEAALALEKALQDGDGETATAVFSDLLAGLGTVCREVEARLQSM